MTREQFLSSFENVCELFESIKDTSSRLEKESLLASYSDKEFLKQILLYTYNPYYVYGIDSKSILNQDKCGGGAPDIFFLLDYLKVNNTGKIVDKIQVWSFLQGLKNGFLESYAVKVILKDLKIGINISTINKVFPRLIPEFKVGLCKTYEDGSSLRYDNYTVQPKLDGVRIIAICTGGSAELYTRNGMKVEGYDEVVKELSHECFKDYVLDGEIMTNDFDGTMKGLFALKEDKKAVYHIFDILRECEWKEQRTAIPHWQRYEKLSLMLYTLPEEQEFKYLKQVTGIKRTRQEIISNIEVLDEDARKLGYEGLVLKGDESPYEFCTPSKRSWGWIKYKSWKSEEFEVIGMEEGTGKYEGMLGALVVDVNGVKVKVGSGFSDEQRESLFIHEDLSYGKLAEIKYQEKTKDGSLRFPTFIKFRNDI